MNSENSVNLTVSSPSHSVPHLRVEMEQVTGICTDQSAVGGEWECIGVPEKCRP